MSVKHPGYATTPTPFCRPVIGVGVGGVGALGIYCLSLIFSRMVHLQDRGDRGEWKWVDCRMVHLQDRVNHGEKE